jgi:hypothetical protein
VEGLTHPGRHGNTDEQDQKRRLDLFRSGNPDVAIGAGTGYWQAQVPAVSGSTVITRHSLRDLLDVLDLNRPDYHAK